MRILPADAPLTTVERWEQAFARSTPADWPDGVDRSAAVLEVLRLLAKGSQAANDIGEKLLRGVPLALWRRALDDGPAEALPVTLTRQHLDDRLEPASNVILASAGALASSPRAHVPPAGPSRFLERASGSKAISIALTFRPTGPARVCSTTKPVS
jgi:hypothetical protein